MPVTFQCSDEDLPLTSAEISGLWRETAAYRRFPDDVVTVRCVSEEAMQELNDHYRGKKQPTNVLTFSYGDEDHDIALCTAVAHAEAREREISVRDYCALLLVHAFLHATGMDHERSDSVATEMKEAERVILSQRGFAAHAL